MAKITATCKFHDQNLTEIPVVNPGDWFGKGLPAVGVLPTEFCWDDLADDDDDYPDQRE